MKFVVGTSIALISHVTENILFYFCFRKNYLNDNYRVIILVSVILISCNGTNIFFGKITVLGWQRFVRGTNECGVD